MSYPRTIRNFNCYVDGLGYFGLVSSAKLPEIKLTYANYRGTFDGPVPIDMGMEELKAEITWKEWRPEIIGQLGARPRFKLIPVDSHIDHTSRAWRFEMGGLWTGLNFGDLKPGDDSMVTATGALDFVEIIHERKTVIKIDHQSHIRVIDGVDQLAAQRRAMGI